jgi:hypothetical protein
MLAGWRLSLSAMAFFLGPLGCALAGAALGKQNPHTQLIGATLGLAIGVVLAGLAARRFGDDQRKEPA